MTKMKKPNVDEHKRLMNKCRRRFRSGIKVVFFLVICVFATLYLVPEFWKLMLGVLIFFTLTTGLEYWGYRKHKAVLRKLGHDT